MSQPNYPQQPGPSPDPYASSGQTPPQQSAHGQATYQQPQYQQTPNQQTPMQSRPVRLERTDRELWKWIVFGILTFGIYDIVVMTELTNAANRIIQDGRRTMHFCLLFFLVSWITFGIGVLVWYHRVSNRIGSELQRRGYPRMLDASDYWLFAVLPSAVFGTPLTYFTFTASEPVGWWDSFTILAVIGQLYYTYKLLNAMNALCWDQNARIQQSYGTTIGQASAF